MFVQGAPFAHIRQTLFNVETIDRRAISHIMMSLEGDKQTFYEPNRMSALPPKADIQRIPYSRDKAAHRTHSGCPPMTADQ
jgi:hypothetical protein